MRAEELMVAQAERQRNRDCGELEPEAIPAAGLRRARTHDVPAIQKLINTFADRGSMLHRSLSELYENVRDFFVIEEEDEVVGCVALHVSWKDLAEIKSLAVAHQAQGRGFGRRLIEACVAEGSVVGVSRVFALTYVPDLFVKCRFQVVDKGLMPRKVWTECVYCPKFPDCGEIAVVIGVDGASVQDPVMERALPLQPGSGGERRS
jgi:amino-acid N-acetyltransferase